MSENVLASSILTSQQLALQLAGNASFMATLAAALAELTAAQVFTAFSALSATQQNLFAAQFIASLPKTPAGLTSGQVWNNGGTMQQVP